MDSVGNHSKAAETSTLQLHVSISTYCPVLLPLKIRKIFALAIEISQNRFHLQRVPLIHGDMFLDPRECPKPWVIPKSTYMFFSYTHLL